MKQAAAAAGNQYIWAVDATSDGAGGVVFAQLMTVINGCLLPEPTRRYTVARVLDSLTTLQQDVGVAVTGVGSHQVPAVGSCLDGGGTVAVAPSRLPAKGSSAPAYDVVAIVEAMEALKLDTTAVVDAIGGMSSSPLDALRSAGVSFVKCIAVKDALAGAEQTSQAQVQREVMRSRTST